MTSTPTAPADPDSSAPPIQIRLLHVPDCPLVAALRDRLHASLARSAVRAVIEEIEGPYPSHTMLVKGADVTGRPAGLEACCRLDLPSEEQILAALNVTGRASVEGRQGPDKT